MPLFQIQVTGLGPLTAAVVRGAVALEGILAILTTNVDAATKAAIDEATGELKQSGDALAAGIAAQTSQEK